MTWCTVCGSACRNTDRCSCAKSSASGPKLGVTTASEGTTVASVRLLRRLQLVLRKRSLVAPSPATLVTLRDLGDDVQTRPRSVCWAIRMTRSEGSGLDFWQTVIVIFRRWYI